MAPPIASHDKQRGFALLEALPAAMCLLVFVGGMLIAAYVIIARAWIQYQVEQSLFCLAEKKPAPICRQALQQSVAGRLPWGRTTRVNVLARGPEWRMRVRWQLGGYGFEVDRELSARQILRKRVLR